MMSRSIQTLLVVVALCLLVHGPTAAQELTTGTIAGKVSDPSGKPIAGATIIATSQFGTRTAESDASGNFILPFLKPGSYNVRVEASGGFNTVIQNDIAVSLNQRTSLNFTLEPGKTETVTVTAATPLVDIKSTSTGTNVKYEDFAKAVPIGRSFTDTYAVAAGVVSGLGTGQGNYSISGASGLENAYLIDGVNVTNTGYGGIGSYNINYGSLGTGVTSDFLDEVQIKTGGFEAEYGQALGGIINTIVKSGTNETKGTVAWYAHPGSFQTGRVLPELSSPAVGNTIQEEINDFAFSVGGPIKKDKVFYFFAYNPVLRTVQRQAQVGSTNPEAVAFAGGLTTPFDETTATGFGSKDGLTYDLNAFPSSVGTLDRKRDSNNYAAKFTFQMTPKQTVDLSFFGDPNTGPAGPQRDNSALFLDANSGGGFSKIRYGANNQSLKWNAVFGPKFFMEAQVGHHAGYFRENSELDQYFYRDRRNVQEFSRGARQYDNGACTIDVDCPSINILPVTLRSGGVGYISDQDDKNTQYTVKLTNIVGKHEIKYGVEYDDISYRDTSNYSGPSFDLHLPDAGGGPDILIPTLGGAQVDVRIGSGGTPTVAYDGTNTFRVVRARMGPALPPTTSSEKDLFVQDTWSVAPRVTVKLGARYTEETVKGSGTFTLPFSLDPSGGFNTTPSTYEPGQYTFAGNLAPRLGVSWDVLGNGKSRLYANWGRYYERVPNDLAIRAFNNEVGVSRAEYTDRNLTTPTGGPIFLQGVQPTDVVAGVKLPYEDEISGGYAFEIGANSSFEARMIFRTEGRILEDTQVNAIEQTQNYYYGTAYGYPYDPFGGSPSSPSSTTFPASRFGPYVLANPGTKQVPSGGLFPFPKATRNYKSLELIYTRRFSDNWALYANYRFSRLNGNYEGLFRNDNGQSDPNITSLYDFPNSPLMSGQYIDGPLPTDTTHVLHVYPSYTFENKLQIGANFGWSTGVPRTSLLAHPSYQNAGEIPGIDPIYAYWNTGGTLTKATSLATALSDPNAVSNPFLFSYTPVKRGNLGRTPDIVNLNLGVSYPFTFGNKSALTVRLDIFNVFGTQEPILFDDNIELSAGVTDPDFLKAVQFQDPRTWRLSARWEF
jgi:hypothetical protein